MKTVGDVIEKISERFDIRIHALSDDQMQLHAKSMGDERLPLRAAYIHIKPEFSRIVAPYIVYRRDASSLQDPETLKIVLAHEGGHAWDFSDADREERWQICQRQRLVEDDWSEALRRFMFEDEVIAWRHAHRLDHELGLELDRNKFVHVYVDDLGEYVKYLWPEGPPSDLPRVKLG